MLLVLTEVEVVGQGILGKEVNVQTTGICGIACLTVLGGVLVTIVVGRTEAYVQTVRGLELQSLGEVYGE